MKNIFVSFKYFQSNQSICKNRTLFTCGQHRTILSHYFFIYSFDNIHTHGPLLPLSLSLTHFVSLSLYVSCFSSLSLSFILTFIPSLTHIFHSHFLSLSDSPTRTHSPPYSLSLFLPLSHTHTRKRLLNTLIFFSFART